jgi:hypothetical protein
VQRTRPANRIKKVTKNPAVVFDDFGAQGAAHATLGLVEKQLFSRNLLCNSEKASKLTKL